MRVSQIWVVCPDQHSQHSTFIIFIVSLNSWCPLVSFLSKYEVRDIWVKNYLLLVVLIPGCDSCDNVIMSRISEESQEKSASEARLRMWECLTHHFLLWIKILTKHFVCRTELTNVCLLVFQDISSLFVNFKTTLLIEQKESVISTYSANLSISWHDFTINLWPEQTMFRAIFFVLEYFAQINEWECLVRHFGMRPRHC